MIVNECQNEKCIHYCICKAHCVDDKICSLLPCRFFDSKQSDGLDFVKEILEQIDGQIKAGLIDKDGLEFMKVWIEYNLELKGIEVR